MQLDCFSDTAIALNISEGIVVGSVRERHRFGPSHVKLTVCIVERACLWIGSNWFIASRSIFLDTRKPTDIPQNAPCHLSTTPASHPISVFGLHVRTRGGRGCRLRGLFSLVLVKSNMAAIEDGISVQSCWNIYLNVPGPLTLRMMLRVVSSMNSTRTCVTPPREPDLVSRSRTRQILHREDCGGRGEALEKGGVLRHTGTAQNPGHLHQLDGNL